MTGENERSESKVCLLDEKMAAEILEYYRAVTEEAGYEKLLCDFDPVTAYAWMVLDTRYGDLCGEWEILACERHLRDMDEAKKEGYPYCLDETRAQRIVKHFSHIPRVDVTGSSIVLEPWQIFDYGSIFGWVRKDDGRRRFQSAFIENARGHAKTTIAAGIGLYVMAGDALYPPGHPELAVFPMQPEIDIVAVDRFQGRKAREDMATMADSSPMLSRLLEVKRSYIRHKKKRRRSGGVLQGHEKQRRRASGSCHLRRMARTYHQRAA